MSRTDRSERDGDGYTADEPREGAPSGDETVAWFTESAMRAVLGILGVIVLLVALGQLVGIDIFGAIADVLATDVGRWLAVAVFAVILIALALRGFGVSTE